MNDLLAAAAESDRILRGHGWEYCFIGGLAVLRWGQPRTTVDADIALFTGFEEEQPFIEKLLTQMKARIPEADTFALESRMLLLQSTTGISIDVSLAALPYEAAMIERATDFKFRDGVILRTCSAEDLIVLKSFAGREKDWADVTGVVERQRESLDRALILENASLFAELKPDARIVERLDGMLS